MNALLSLLFKSVLPKLARNAVATAGGALLAHGHAVNANDPAELIGGVLMIIIPWVWSAAKKVADQHGGWGLKMEAALDSQDGKAVMQTAAPVVGTWLGSLASKIVQAIAGALMLQGGQITTEGIIIAAGTYLASQMRAPDKVKK